MQRKDTGWYNCSVYNGVGERYLCSIYVGPEYLPKCHISIYPLPVIKSNYTTLKCNPFYGEPLPVNAVITHPLGQHRGFVFNISYSSAKNTGWYSCTIYKNNGEAVTCWKYVDVLYPPTSVKIFPLNKTVFIKEGSAVNLSCHGDGNPPPTFNWKHNNLILSGGKNGTLMLKTVTRKDHGRYTCNAENSLGSSQSNVNIIMKYLDNPAVNGLNNKSYCPSNPVVWFNISVDFSPDASVSCSHPNSDLATIVHSHKTGYFVFVFLNNTIKNASILCKISNSAGERQTTLSVYQQPIGCHCKDESTTTEDNCQTLVVVLSALLSVAVIVIIILLVLIFWTHRKGLVSKKTPNKRHDENLGNTNEIDLQETSFNNANITSSNKGPQYETIGRSGITLGQPGIPQYETIGTSSQHGAQIKSDEMMKSNRSNVQQPSSQMPQNEAEEQAGKPDEEPVCKNVGNAGESSPMYQSLIQSRADNYTSLSPLTKTLTTNQPTPGDGHDVPNLDKIGEC